MSVPRSFSALYTVPNHTLSSIGQTHQGGVGADGGGAAGGEHREARRRGDALSAARLLRDRRRDAVAADLERVLRERRNIGNQTHNRFPHTHMGQLRGSLHVTPKCQLTAPGSMLARRGIAG